MEKTLVVFDIDGTLLDSIDIDETCYLRSLEEEFGFTRINTDWEVYSHATDSAIFEDIYYQHKQKRPEPDHFLRHEHKFYSLLQSEYKRDRSVLKPIAGALQAFEWVCNHPGYCAAVATGTYGKTARLKLSTIGIAGPHVPLATASDARVREDVVQTAVNRAREMYKVDQFASIISIGDGSWDLKAAVNLNLRFIGVGKKKFAGLCECLALDDYSNSGEFQNLLEKAFLPVIT